MGTALRITKSKPAMFLPALLSLFAGFVAPAPRPQSQTRIIPEANTFGNQVISTGQTQGSQTVQYGYDYALNGLNFLNTGLQSTNTFGASTATNGLTVATDTATFGTAFAPYGLQGLNYGLGLGQQYFWG